MDIKPGTVFQVRRGDCMPPPDEPNSPEPIRKVSWHLSMPSLGTACSVIPGNKLHVLPLWKIEAAPLFWIPWLVMQVGQLYALRVRRWSYCNALVMRAINLLVIDGSPRTVAEA